MYNRKLTLAKEKQKAIAIAKDLCYSSRCVASIKNAKTKIQIDNILKTERLEKEDFYASTNVQSQR